MRRWAATAIGDRAGSRRDRRSWPIGLNEAPVVAAAHRVQSRASFRKHGTLVVERNGASSLWRVDGREAPLGEPYAGGSLEVATLGSTGPVLAKVSDDGVRVVTAGRVTHLPHDHPFEDRSSSDGTRLVTVTDDTTVRVWLVDEAERSRSRRYQPRPTWRSIRRGGSWRPGRAREIAMVAAGGTGDPIISGGTPSGSETSGSAATGRGS